MEIKRIEIISMFRVLGKVKLNKVADKPLRNALIGNHLKMFRVAKENDEYIASLQGQFDPGAVKELNEAYQRYADEVVPIEMETVDREAFGDAVASGDIDFTLGELAVLEPIFNQ